MKKNALAVIILIVIASFLRLYRISDLSEFLGDQGSAGVVIYESLKNRTLPLTGPVVSTGQMTGPAFYYVIAIPLILTGFHPLAPAVFMALLGVISAILLYFLLTEMTTPKRAIVVSALYAVSPILVAQDRTFWNPTPIPFLVMLVLWCLSRAVKRGEYRLYGLIGLLEGVLIQLHYSNILTIGMTVACFSFLLWRERRNKKKVREILLWGALSAMLFLFTLMPFLYYEATHEFEDLRSVLLLMIDPKVTELHQYLVKPSLFDLSSRVFWIMAPIGRPFIMAFLQCVLLILPFLTRRPWMMFLSLWYMAGIWVISRYSGPVYDHYLYFLIPIPFLLAGYAMSVAKKRLVTLIAFTLVGYVVFLELTRLDVGATGRRDIARTESVVNAMSVQAGTSAFSFTLISSRSFSDYHYRFFLTVRNISPKLITDGTYPYLYLVCEKMPCPSESEIAGWTSVTALCYDHHCSGTYPSVSLMPFQLKGKREIKGAVMYVFERKLAVKPAGAPVGDYRGL